MTLRVKPNQLETGDKFVAPVGPYAGMAFVVTDVQPGRYGHYNVIAQPVDPVVVALDHQQVLNVLRVDASETKGEKS